MSFHSRDMPNSRRPGLERSQSSSSTNIGAIQIIASQKELDTTGKEQKIIRTIPRYQDGPSLQNVLCKSDIKDLPIFVFSITGKTRGGKSFLLNLMIKYLESEGNQDWMNGVMPHVFDWQGGIDSVTKGLWICPKIYKKTNEQGRQVGILLLDNQGLFDGEQSDGESISMSGISTTISTYQMFNIKDSITTDYLESIYRHLMSDTVGGDLKTSDMDDEKASQTQSTSRVCLLFVVRDFLGQEYGLENGQAYVNKEKNRGSGENRFMWKTLQDTFQNIECLLLPHPGLEVTSRKYEERRNLSAIERHFMTEIEQFFSHFFAPKCLNLTPIMNTLTGSEIYEILTKFDGKVADDRLSFINVFTEHGNQNKLEILKASFESRLKCYNNNIPSVSSVMEDMLNNAETQFKGKSANDYLTQLEQFMVERINLVVIRWILYHYNNGLNQNQGMLIEENHNTEWQEASKRLKYLVGNEDVKCKSRNDVIMKAAAIYYESLQKEMTHKFHKSCEAKNLKELQGYDDVYVSNRFQESNGFSKECRAIWLKEKYQLKKNVQDILLQVIESRRSSCVFL